MSNASKFKPIPTQLSFAPIAQVHPNWMTHLAVDRIGNIYWAQESDDLQDVLFVSGVAMDVPQTTRLTSANILAALGITSTSQDKDGLSRAKTGGTIQSIAASDADDCIYFYFSGGAGSDVYAALGRFEPRNGGITILANTRALSKASGMGVSLSLARGKLLFTERPATTPSGRETVMRLWLRHSDDSALLEFASPRSNTFDLNGTVEFKRILSPEITVNDPPPPPPALPTMEVTPPSNRPVDLKRDESELCVAPPGRVAQSSNSEPPVDRLFLIDKRVGRLLRVDPTSGVGTTIASIVLLPDAIGEPTLLDIGNGASDVTLFFVSDANPIDPRFGDRPNSPDVTTTYPALLIVDAAGKITAIDSNAMRGPAGFSAHALKLRQLVPVGRNQYLTFDATSGQLLKVTAKRD